MSIDTDDWGYDTHVALSWKSARNQEWPYGSAVDVDKRRIAIRLVSGLVEVWTFRSANGQESAWYRSNKSEKIVMGHESGYEFSVEIDEYTELDDAYEGYEPHEIEEMLTPDEARFDYRIQESNEIDGEVAVYSQKYDSFTSEDVGEPRIYFKRVKKQEVTSNLAAIRFLKKWGLVIIGR